MTVHTPNDEDLGERVPVVVLRRRLGLLSFSRLLLLRHW